MYRESDETRYATGARTDEVNSPEKAVEAFVAAMIARELESLEPVAEFLS